MKISDLELTFSDEEIDAIADRVFNKIKLGAKDIMNCAEDNILFDVPSLMKYLKRSKQWVYKRTQQKEIPFKKIGGAVRFRKSEIDKWVEANSIPMIPRTLKPR